MVNFPKEINDNRPDHRYRKREVGEGGTETLLFWTIEHAVRIKNYVQRSKNFTRDDF